MTTIPSILAATVERYGDRPAVIEGDTELSYAALSDAARQFGGALIESGIGPGDPVGIWAPNSVEWIIAALGLFQAGATLVPINTRFKGVEAADILSRSRAKALVTVTDFLGTDSVAMLRETDIALADLETIVVAVGPETKGPEKVSIVSWASFVTGGTDASRAALDRSVLGIGPDDRSDILFTSGTTGAPKGVVQTHGRTASVATDWVAMTALSCDDRYLMVNPYFHMFGLKAGILAAVSAGVLMLPEPVFDVDRVLSRVVEEGVTVLPGPPTLYQGILDHPDREHRDLSSLRVAVTGAADIPVELIRRIDDELPFSLIITGYGLTEGGTASATDPGDDVETIATTVGRPRPGFELRIVDSADQDVTSGETGEILLRGGSIMSHYLDDPEATEQAFAPGGWLRTGDLGIVDENGCLRIVGRSKDMFIVGGFNAYPAEIEGALLRHPDVLQAAVIGIPDDRLGEVGMAFVVVRPGAPVTSSDIIGWSRDQMANYKVPRVVDLVDELPINATGKVVKDELRARVRQDPSG